MIGELLAADAADFATANAIIGRDEEERELIDIVEECRALQDRTRPRFMVWLGPRL